MILRAWKPGITLAFSLLFLCITAAHASPTITSLSPSAAAVGAAVTIAGTSFGAQASGSVSFNGTTATITSWSATTIKVTVPSGATTGNVMVIASGVDSNGSNFTVLPTPGITSLSPAAAAPGASVTIGGTGFGSSQGSGTVKFNGINPAVVTSWSDTSIVVTAPSSATTGNVVVFASGVNSNGSSFTVLPAPRVTGLSVTSGYVGTAVTVTGTNFESTQGSGTVSFNGTLATATSWSATSIAVTVPAGASSGFVVVFASGVNSNGHTFDVTPIITSVSPTSGAIGATVTITGNNFGPAQGNSVVRFDGYPAPVASWSPTSIVVTVPNTAATGNVVVNVGDNSNGSRFTVVPAPSIASLSVTSGAVGTAVTITGGNFVSTQGSGTVTFNGTPATVTSWSATSIAVTVPSGATSGTVVVFASGVNSNGVSFTVLNPSITSLSPTSGAIGTGVTITGANFGSTQGSSSVSFNGTTAALTSWSASNIVATVPSGATSGNVIVTVGGGNSNGVNFAVGAAPNITSLSPVLEQVGTSVTIIGMNFGSSQESSTVTFNGIPATTTAWSSTSIVTTVPTGATTGYVVVTVGGVASNQELFAIVPPLPIITSLSPTSGIPGASITVNGSGFGTAQGTSTITFNGIMAVVTTWGSNAVVASVPSNATTGNVVVSVGGVGSIGAVFTVIGPAITGLSSDIGAVGDSVTIYGTNFGATQASSTVTFNGISATPTSWNSMTIVVPVPVGATTGPIAVTASGTTTSSKTFTVGPPDVITGLSITSPSNGATVSTPYAAITGSVAGTISGIDPITVMCNDTAAKLTTTNFSCNPPLVVGVNSITVTGTDSVGDTQTATLSVTLAMSTPVSIQVTPPNANMLVGGTQSFTAVDDQGVRRPDATWSVSDSTIASFVSGSPNVLMANAVGQVTLTATVSGINAQTTVTVLSGTSLPVGTVLWSAPPASGFSTQQIVQAVPTSEGPDLYSIDTDSNGDTLVRAFKSTGEQMWQTQISASQGYFAQAVGDNFGGVLLIGSSQNNGLPSGVITDLDGQSGNQAWQYATSGYSSISFGAVGVDGSVYAIESDLQNNYLHGYLESFNGSSGSLQARIPLPESLNYFNCPDNVQPDISYIMAQSGSAAVAPDGSFYMEVASYESFLQTNCENGPQPYAFSSGSSNLSLMRVSPDGGAGLISLDSSSTPQFSPGDVIPDGQGGVLAAWINPLYQEVLADVGTPGGTQMNFPVGIENMVLGDNNVAFATNTGSIVAFSVPSLTPTWSYASTGGALSFVAATSGGGVTINDSTQGIIQLDPSGNAGTPIAALQGAVPLGLGETLDQESDLAAWTQITNGQPAALAALILPPPMSPYPEPNGDPQGQRAAVSTAVITVNTSGSLSTGDNLVFPTEFQTCTQNLGGPFNCTVQKSWVFNVEIAATVSDDGSKWVAKQSATIQATGESKDSNGVLHPFSFSTSRAVDDPCHWPNDSRPQCFQLNVLQQTRGQKQIFWLDAPGSSYYFDYPTDTEPLDSLNQVLHLTSKVCNRSNICPNVKWFVDLVVDPGAQLDGIMSEDGLGPGSNP
jgi:hypothetical protein